MQSNLTFAPRKTSLRFIFAAGSIAAVVFSARVFASDLDTVGVTLLRATTTNLDGSGVNLGQVEAQNPPPKWEVTPWTNGVGLPVSSFTYYSTNASANYFTNSLGIDSGHADYVAMLCYGLPNGVATNVAHIDNCEADYFVFIAVPELTVFNDRIFNQSFSAPSSEQSILDTTYDNYAAQFNALFVSGAGNGGPGAGTVLPPSTCYNGVSVGAYGYFYSSMGPTPDNGRSKPDITAPSGIGASFSTPLVTGAAALLLQAGLRGDGGSDTNSAADMRTLKALLLNGAIKPADWTNSTSSPLDSRYGSGVLNVFESYQQLAGGEHSFIDSSSVTNGDPHPPTGAPGNISSLQGWDFNTVASGLLTDGVNHYYFNLTGNAAYSGTMTLAWNRQAGATSINDLDLFLYEVSSGNLVALSTSRVDNVEHIYLSQLPPGRYDLQVYKNGGATVTTGETYALAFEFFPPPTITLAQSGSALTLSWPVYPAGFGLQSAPSPTPPVTWTASTTSPTITNGQNTVTVDASSGAQLFRLARP